MKRQWYLCEIENCPDHEAENLKTKDNLSVTHPDLFTRDFLGQFCWYVWLPIIPRVGDTLQFAGWQVQVSRIVLQTDWKNRTGLQEEPFVSAIIHIRDDAVPSLLNSRFSVEDAKSESTNKWETYARRGHDLQYYAWELRDESYIVDNSDLAQLFGSFSGKRETSYQRWHSRVRPMPGDIIEVNDKRWRVTSVNLTNANKTTDGWLTIEPVD